MRNSLVIQLPLETTVEYVQSTKEAHAPTQSFETTRSVNTLINLETVNRFNRPECLSDLDSGAVTVEMIGT